MKQILPGNIVHKFPNPFFDIAGLTCGYSLISFWTFFGATLLGKAGLKAHMQTAFVILMFSKHQLELFVDLIEAIFPFLKTKAKTFIDKERAKFHPEYIAQFATTASQKSVFVRIWDTLLICMLLAFAISIVNSWAQSYLHEEQKKQFDKFKTEKLSELINSQKEVAQYPKDSSTETKKDK